MFIPKRAPEPDRDMRPNMGIDQILHKIRRGPDQPVVENGITMPARFGFDWAGLGFDGTLDLDRKTGDHLIVLTAILGRLPYTAEDPEARAAVRARLDAAYKLKDGAYEVAADGLVRFRAATSFAEALTPESLMNALAVSLLQLKPLLKAFEGQLQPT